MVLDFALVATLSLFIYFIPFLCGVIGLSPDSVLGL